MQQGGSRLLRAGLLTIALDIVVFVLAGIEYMTGWIGMLAPTEVHLFAWLAVFGIVGMVVWIWRREPDAPRLPNVGQGIRRILFPAPPVARRQHTTRTARAAQTTTAKPERVI